MSFFSKFKDTIRGKKKEKKVKTAKTDETAPTAPAGDVHILPVPGNENHPPESGGGLNSNPQQAVLSGAGPQILTPEQAAALEPPKTREELHARAEALNA
ncbi:SubName: Full=Uncharacterized protein {ECO:0000313/EMBL:CCA71205.1} [Serendipita indica DSM 11827]|uniref:Uncharacterized protein n=1 Tax=Serendipita indica (strain DSM 11827) TaxID=1109443 RepID=G4TIR8_SERID|nr:SubName: Full=Uncharacterized protein {ECO:0000313/EMBL:CCA71205.1} [Serendipita indica DSM 11827]CCA71205.1 hypothetical protein PIIN_05141 [Serendipita indica DSM 11827]